MKKWQWALLLVVYLTQIVVGISIEYPPTSEQLRILFLLNRGGQGSLWLLRILSLALLFLTFKVWKKIIPDKIYFSSCLILSISPSFFNLWYLYPLLLLKVFLVIYGFHFLQKYRKSFLVFFVILGVIIFNRFVLENKAAIFNKLSLKDAQNEVTARFTAEDSLREKIELPLWWRRISYNKYFFVYKEIVAEILPYFDLESLYFQEVSPTEQKSMVMFYWPEIFTLVAGIYFLTKNKENYKVLELLFSISIFDYVFSEGPIDKRLLLTMWPLAIIMAIAWVEMIKLSKNNYVLAKWSLGIVGGLLFLAFSFNFYDLKVREEYWFDNRPLAFQFWYENLDKIDLDNYQKIYVSSIIGDSKKYCYFYFGNKCNDGKWIFKSFNLKESNVENNTVYAGFAGEFVGPKFKNDINPNWEKEAELKGLNFVGVKSLLNTIAYQYGNDIGVAVKN